MGITEQGKQWRNTLVDLYNKVKDRSRNYQLLSGTTSLIIIVLNVIIVGKGDLKLSDITVAVFVVIMTILKGIQVQFKFAAVATELYNSLATIRDMIVEVED